MIQNRSTLQWKYDILNTLYYKLAGKKAADCSASIAVILLSFYICHLSKCRVTKTAVYSRVLASRIRQTANVRFKLRISQDRKWADTENSLTLTVLMDKKLHEATNLCVEIMKSKRQLKGKLGPSYFKDLSSLSLNLFSTLQNELLKKSGIINWWSLTSYVSVLGAVSLKSR